MGVFDKFLDIMKLSDEDDYEDDFFDDEVDEYPEKTSKNPFKKEKEEYDDFDMQEKSKSTSKSTNKVTPMRPSGQRRAPGMEVCVIRPTSVDDARAITESLLSGRTVILNLEGLGAAFAINGNLQKISTYIFLVTPTNVDISGDLQDLLNTSFDMPSINTRF